MFYQTLNGSAHPEITRIVRIADSSYKKHKVTLSEASKVTLSGTYWDGGSRYTYTAVNLETGRNIGAPQFDPSQFGGPASDPIVELPEGIVIVRTGTFCGKTATATVFVNPSNLTKLLTQ